MCSEQSNHDICGLCSCELINQSQDLNTSDVSSYKKIEEIFKIKIDGVNVSQPSPCENCRRLIVKSSVLYKRCQSAIESPSQIEKKFKEIGTQTGTSVHKIILNQLPAQVTQRILEDKLSNYGTIENIYLRKKGNSEQFACVKFSDHDDILRIPDTMQFSEKEDKTISIPITLVPEDYTPIHILPYECLQLIFRKLDDAVDRLTVERVCKRWKDIGLKSWSNFTLFHRFHFYDPKTIRQLMIRCNPYLTNFDDESWSNPDSTLQQTAQYCRNIDTFRILAHYDMTVSNQYLTYLKKIIQQSAKLRRFSLIYVPENFDYGYLEIMPDEMLEIRFFLEVTPPDVTMNLSKFTNLVDLELNGYDFHEDSLIGIEHLTNLQYLSLAKSCTHPSNIRKITHFTKLLLLEIPDCQIDDITLINILQNNGNLQHLDISENVVITDRSMEFITRLPYLKKLLISNLVQVTSTHLKNLSQVETLYCNECRTFSDLDFISLIDMSENLKTLHVWGIATQRLIVSAIETLKCREGKTLTIIVDERFYKKWKKLNREDTCVNLQSTRQSFITDDDVPRRKWFTQQS